MVVSATTSLLPCVAALDVAVVLGLVLHVSKAGGTACSILLGPHACMLVWGYWTPKCCAILLVPDSCGMF
jgi:hypothetical protein